MISDVLIYASLQFLWKDENSDIISKLKQFQLNNQTRETYFIFKFYLVTAILFSGNLIVYFFNNYLDTELSSLSAAITVSGVEYSSALGDTSTPEFMEHAERWEERVSSLPFFFFIPPFISMNQFIYVFVYLSINITIIIKCSASSSWKVKRELSHYYPRVSPPSITDWGCADGPLHRGRGGSSRRQGRGPNS